MRRALPAILLGMAAFPASLSAAEPDAKGVEFFEKKIRPVLVEQCYACHSAEAEKAKKLKGGLYLDTREGTRKGGDNGPAVVPGQVKDSLILDALRHEDLKMPPKGKLSDAVVADFVQWVAMGAPDPRAGQAALRKPVDQEEGRKHWAFQPVKKLDPPQVKDASWARGEVDRFVLARLEAKGLRPVKDADRLALLRRAHFDLTGLPPTTDEVDAFLKDTSADAYARVVDKLLASAQYGERWGRHWLDVARYAESNGNADNVAYPHAWRYRDYVIASFNQDKPYDQFVREQLAGDLMEADNVKRKDELRIATGFLALGSKPRAQNNPNFAMDLVADQIEATGSAVLGLTVHCARCHDHKFDPIPTKEYYALAGIFNSTQLLYGTGVRGMGKNRVGGGGFHTLEAAAGESGEALAMGAREGKADDCRVCVRGESTSLGDAVPRGFLTVATIAPAPTLNPRQSGRLELAQWLTSPQNPLPARVMANRVWHHLFGRGIVATVDNFGTLGERPTHPELLDFLAARFVEEGWSVKKLIRNLMLSHVYQLSNDHDARNRDLDPDNRLRWRMDLRRLEAEALRDAVLAASGQLQAEAPRGSTADFGGSNKNGNLRPNGPGQGNNRYRSVYQPIIRSGIPEMLALFDYVDPNLIIGDREVTTVPAQALFLLNSPFMVEQSKHMADRLLKIEGLDAAARIDRAYKLALSRPATRAEQERALQYLQHAAADREAKAQSAAWAGLCQAILASAEFRYLQ